MVSWRENGRLSGFTISGGVGALRNNGGVYQAAVPGSVDSNIITRLQYNVAGKPDRMVARARFVYSPDDPGTWGAALFIVAAEDIPGKPSVPTPSQILSAGSAVLVYRGKYISESPLMTITWDMNGPRPNALRPNTKYWALVAPTAIRVDGNGRLRTPPSLANDRPIGNVNNNGRALSFWTNRPPRKPVITSPPHKSVFAPNQTFNLTVSGNDPDAVGGSSPDASGLNGVQVQIAPQPTPDNPNPSWSELMVSTNSPGNFGEGWVIEGSLIHNWFALDLLPGSSLATRAGVEPPSAGQGFIPSGDWQIRARVFDSGKPYGYSTSGVYPIRNDIRAWSPNNYPAANTSPWSDPVYLSVPSQIPAPIPLSPRDGIAVQRAEEDGRVTFRWRYRNAANPPFPQKSRTLQLRKVGQSGGEWRTLTATTSSDTADVLDLDLGVYEWRVRVTDSDDEQSNWSEIVRFWVVPEPSSGPERPLPSSTIDGATLGCGTHRVFIYRRGGKERVGEIRNFSYLDWSRTRDDLSTSKVVINDWDVDCGVLLSSLQCWAYEVVIFRDNGYSVDRVWEGPITLLTYTQDSVTIQAKDVMGYAYRRIIRQRLSDAGTGNGTTVVNRALRVLQTAFAPDDPNVLRYLTPLDREDDALQYRSTPAYSRTAFEEVDDMASNAGLDYTVIGRSILLWGTKNRIGTLPEFRDKDLGAPPIVSEYGMSMANVYAVSDGNGVYGVAAAAGSGVEVMGNGEVSGNDEIYGLVEMLSSTWASDSAEDSGTFTQEELEKVKQSFVDFSERSIADRYPPPVVVRVPDNTSLNPDTVLSIQQLVPGVVIPLRSSGTLRSVVANQKLDAVRVTEQDGKETISITLSPFSRDDASFEETEG